MAYNVKWAKFKLIYKWLYKQNINKKIVFNILLPCFVNIEHKHCSFK